MDRPTKSHEYIFLLTKSAKYFWDQEAIKESVHSGPSDIKKMIESRDRIGGYYKDLEDNLSKSSKHTNIGQKRAVGTPIGRNIRTVWNIATEPFPGSHFAAFPTKLAETCIKTGTSEKGCCSACGAPWIRVVDKTFIPQQDVCAEKSIRCAGDQKPMDASNSWGDVPRGSNKSITICWKPSCDCLPTDPVPCVVLDPFFGAGTTGLVAQTLNRRWIGIELSERYCTDIAIPRISKPVQIMMIC